MSEILEFNFCNKGQFGTCLKSLAPSLIVDIDSDSKKTNVFPYLCM